jgi:Rod binding domain-containing protein
MEPVTRASAALPASSAAEDRVLALHPERATPAQAAERFEALFVAEMLKSAQRPAFGETLLSGGSAGAMYRDLFADELARRIAARGGLGLAQAIAREAGASGGEEPR